MTPQQTRLMDYLERHTGITPKQAWTELGIYRLSGRIFELRKMGYKITTNRKEIPSPYGEPSYVAEYRLRK